jgi:mutator protein MutT
MEIPHTIKTFKIVIGDDIMIDIFPVSIKGVIYNKEKHVLLLKNEREEWELPGGRIEVKETPEQTLLREIDEELRIECSIEAILESYLLEVIPTKYVFIVVYLCKYEKGFVELSDEHQEFGWFEINQLDELKIPKEYVESVKKLLINLPKE